jgi:hypothetical protein
MPVIAPEDDSNHQPPPDAEESWQESWFLGWYDPLTRAAGFHHVDLQRVRGRACLWSWSALDGAVVGHYQSLDLPLPGGDLSDLSIGPVHITTKEPLRRYGLEAVHPGVREDVAYCSFVEPFAFSLDADGMDLGASHYESLGQVEGAITVGDREVPVAGFAFQDHSWGPRDYGSVKAHRWACMTFGEDLFGSIFSFTSDAGRRDFGYLFDDDVFHAVRRTRFDVRMADDGHTPLGCDATVWCTDGRGYRFSASVEVAGVSSHDGGFFITDGFGVFELGGRLGTGILETQELAGPSPAHRKWLALEAPERSEGTQP